MGDEAETKLAKRLAGKYWVVDHRIFQEVFRDGFVCLEPFQRIEQKRMK